MNERRTFGRVLHDLRIDVGLKQAELATSLGVSQGTVSNWEQDKGWPDQYMVQLAKRLGVSLEVLVDLRFGLTTAAERGIVADKNLTRKEQDTLLAAYGAMTGRDSIERVRQLRDGAD